MVCREGQHTHVRAPDLRAALLEAVLDVLALIALVVPQPPDEVVQRLLEPAPTVSQLRGCSCSAPARTHIVTRCYPTRGSWSASLPGGFVVSWFSGRCRGGFSDPCSSGGVAVCVVEPLWAGGRASWRRDGGGGSLDWDDGAGLRRPNIISAPSRSGLA